ncbi:MAG: mechanosensitive ion channel family protein [Spirochaetaceae bacterium]|nr:MAG: mechanosensitive ion channel family protein [Spirochaetaceae bacterium]
MRSILPEQIVAFFEPENLTRFFWAIVVLVFGFLTLKLIVFFVGRWLEKRLSPQSAMIIRKVILYTGMTILVVSLLAQLGTNLTAFLGAAGIAGVAVGFAAQTSISNIISGLFLISEKAFTVGDVINIGSTTGTILSIDLLSVKIRTFDNRFVRLPNENLIKTEVTNITRFPIRRMDFEFTLERHGDLVRVRELLLDLARETAVTLDEPEPFFVIKQITPLGVEVLFGVWFPKDQFLATKNGILMGMHEKFATEGVELAQYPFVNDPVLKT